MNSIRLIVFSILLIVIAGCDIYGDDSEKEEKTIVFTIEPRLNMDDNGFYHLTLNQAGWQTLHRVSGHATYQDGTPAEFVWVEWESNLYWYLGDTLGYIVNQYLNNSGIYVSVDTSYIIGFDGFEVPTSNSISYSNSSGEINNMIAPVRTMAGDTLTLTWYYSDGFDIRNDAIEIVLN